MIISFTDPSGTCADEPVPTVCFDLSDSVRPSQSQFVRLPGSCGLRLFRVGTCCCHHCVVFFHQHVRSKDIGLNCIAVGWSRTRNVDHSPALVKSFIRQRIQTLTVTCSFHIAVVHVDHAPNNQLLQCDLELFCLRIRHSILQKQPSIPIQVSHLG